MSFAIEKYTCRETNARSAGATTALASLVSVDMFSPPRKCFYLERLGHETAQVQQGGIVPGLGIVPNASSSVIEARGRACLKELRLSPAPHRRNHGGDSHGENHKKAHAAKNRQDGELLGGQGFNRAEFLHGGSSISTESREHGAPCPSCKQYGCCGCDRNPPKTRRVKV